MDNNMVKFVRKPPYLSGRAFSNGIMLQGGGATALAVRKRSGEIAVEKYRVKGITGVKKKLPVLRGIINISNMAVSSAVNSCRAFKHNKSFSVFRLFKNHGAEHKMIHCYENGDALTFENVKMQPTYHPRCGTSVAANTLIAEALFSLLIPSRVRGAHHGILDIILIFAALGIGYESSGYALRGKGKLAQMLALPGKAVQKLTAMEPSDDMIECALASAKAVLKSEVRK